MKKALTVFLIIFVLAVAAGLYYFKIEVNKSATGNGDKTEIVISGGESSVQVADALATNNLIRSKNIFYLYLKFKEKKIVPGDYLLANNLSVIDIVEIISTGSDQINWIKIKDGWRREQVAAYLQEDLGLSADEFLAKTTDLDGELFPDTYKLSDKPTVDEVINKISENYQAKTAGLNVTEGDLVLASIIQKEAGPTADMSKIAGVFNNRLAIGMKLQSDVTAIYQKDSENYPAVGLLDYRFWQPASGDTTKYPGPYNTYSVVGLPPTPICSPSLAAINAVLHPESNNYYYFLYDKNGQIHFAKTAAEQSANAKEYL